MAIPGARSVRFVYIALIVAFTALVLLLKFQNVESATISLFPASITLPLSLLVAGIPALGMLTGGLPLSLSMPRSSGGGAWSTR